MTPERIDALFLSYYEDVDRWHNDHLPEGAPPVAATGLLPGLEGDAEDLTTEARLLRQAVRIDGELYDLPRFLSWARYGTTGEYRRFDSFNFTHLSGSYFRSLAGAHGFDLRHVNAVDRASLGALHRRFAPRWVLVSTSFLSEAARIVDVCSRVRRLWPDAGVVVGGLVLVELQRSLHPIAFQHFLHALGADAYVVSPTAEEPLLELLAHERSELPALELPGTWVERVGKWVLSTERAERGFPLDEAYVRWSRLDPASLYHTVHTRTARSCAFKCSFCTFPVLQGALELARPDTLEAELCELEANGAVRSLIFTDDTFNVPPKRFAELVEVLARHDFEWYSFFRPQFADDALIGRMADSGCRGVFLGIESIDDGMLKRMKKTATRAAAVEGIRSLKRRGVAVHTNFIIGFPGDVPANTEIIPAFLNEHEVDFFCVSPYYHSPTAPVHAERGEYGIQGRFWRWKHDTMDIERAIELEKWLLDQPVHATFMSELAQNTFWGEIVYLSNGFSVEETRRVGAVYDRLAGRALSSAALRTAPELAELDALFADRELPRPPDLDSTPAASAGERAAG